MVVVELATEIHGQQTVAIHLAARHRSLMLASTALTTALLKIGPWGIILWAENIQLNFMFLLIFSFLHAHQLRFTFRLAFRRSFSSSYYCDQNTIVSRSLLGSGGSSYAKCNYCSSTTIVSTGFRCTDYSSNEDWSMGENNFNYTFSFYNRWVVTYIPLFNAFFYLTTSVSKS